MALKIEQERHVLEVKDLYASSVGGKKILEGVNLTVRSGEIHALMGPNGSGKSTLSNAIIGNPKYVVGKGDIRFDGESILGLKPEERAKKGLFLAFQHPLEIPGVSVDNLLREAYGRKLSVFEFQKILKGKIKSLGMPTEFAERYVNDGFSGGEKKKCEILQMAVLQPKIAVLDEADSGLDVDALKRVAQETMALVQKGMGALVVTHYARILHYLRPDKVHVLVEGKIKQSGGMELAEELERIGYGVKEPAVA